jgi:hypothetical protein
LFWVVSFSFSLSLSLSLCVCVLVSFSTFLCYFFCFSQQNGCIYIYFVTNNWIIDAFDCLCWRQTTTEFCCYEHRE